MNAAFARHGTRTLRDWDRACERQVMFQKIFPQRPAFNSAKAVTRRCELGPCPLRSNPRSRCGTVIRFTPVLRTSAFREFEPTAWLDSPALYAIKISTDGHLSRKRSQDAAEEGTFMHALKPRFALAAWVGLLALVGCSGGGSNPSSWAISGTISGATAVAVNLTGAANASTTTDGNGNYSFGSLGNGSYVLTPSRAGYSFSPASRAVTVSGGNITSQNFTATVSTPVCRAENWRWRNPLPQGNLLFRVWGSEASDVWAVGWAGTIVHWDGSTSTSVSSGTPITLFGVWGSGASDVWAVGWAGTMVHWNGSAWTTASSGTTKDLFGVWGTGAGDVWAVGDSGTILHWNGIAWTTVPNGTAYPVRDVWGTGASVVWAVGGEAILQWDGSAWTSVSSGTTGWLTGVWGSGPSDVWAMGDLGVILHWDGSDWKRVSSGTEVLLNGVWGSGPSDV